jgi:uracil-DNA glycosylase family 4
MTNLPLIEDVGSVSARLVLIGEAPGWWETQKKEPFAGPSGRLLKEWWGYAGLARSQFYITNVYPYQPPDNKIQKIAKEELEHWIKKLHERLAALKDPWLIVPTGNIALRALTGKKNANITDWRGSQITYTDRNSRIIKVIPTIHPAMTMRSYKTTWRCIADWQRIAEHSQFRELRIPKRVTKVLRTGQELEAAVAGLDHSKPLCIDIETHPKLGITCVGFAQSRESAFVIPLGIRQKLPVKKKATPEDKARVEASWKKRASAAIENVEQSLLSPWYAEKEELTKGKVRTLTKGCEKWQDTGKITPTTKKHILRWEELLGLEHKEPSGSFITVGFWDNTHEQDRAMGAIKRLAESPCEKVLQNGFYDFYWLADEEIEMINYIWDTMNMHHVLDPNDEHALDFLASIITEQPFWKKDAKDPEEQGKYINNQEALWSYCGLDCMNEFEIYEVLRERLETSGRMQFYQEHYVDLYEPLFAIMRNGLLVDDEKRAKLKEEFTATVKTKLTKIHILAGKSLAGPKTLSSKKVADYLYTDLNLPEQTRRRSGGVKSVTADEVAVRTLMLKFPHQLGVIGQEILDVKRTQKLIEFVSEGRLDEDKRMRSSYKLTTTAGRLSSSKNPKGTGTNAQNQDRELRSMYVADDEDSLLMCMDLSQVESRIVYMMTRDPHLIQEAQSLPWEFNMHRANAQAIFQVTDPSEDQYYFGKKTTHAAQRGMRGKTMSEQLLKEGHVLTKVECDSMIDSYLSARSAIRDVYFPEILQSLWNTRKLTNSWGRVIEWPYVNFNDDIYREAYSWPPQSEAAGLINQWGLKPMHRFLRAMKFKTKILAQIHDELVFNTNLKEAYIVAQMMRSFVERPREFFGVPLTVPLSTKIGKTWKGTKEWKKFPGKGEFEEVFDGLLTGGV